MFPVIRTPFLYSLSGLLLISIFISVPVFCTELPKQEPGKTTEPAQQTGTYNRGTKDLPVVIQIAPSAPLKVETDSDKEAENEKARNEGRIAYGTIAIAVFTFFLAFATIGLAVFTYNLWDETGKLVRGTEDTAKRQLRAYVMVLKAEIVNAARRPNMPGFREAWIDVTFQNFGQIPATDVTGQFAMCMKELPLTIDLDGNQTTKPMGLIAPGDKYTTQLNIAVNGIHALTASMNALFVYGEVSYHDGFTPNRVTFFRYMRRGGEDLSRDSEMKTCPEGNKMA
jgi:hypothetical protein